MPARTLPMVTLQYADSTGHPREGSVRGICASHTRFSLVHKLPRSTIYELKATRRNSPIPPPSLCRLSFRPRDVHTS